MFPHRIGLETEQTRLEPAPEVELGHRAYLALEQHPQGLVPEVLAPSYPEVLAPSYPEVVVPSYPEMVVPSYLEVVVPSYLELPPGL
jgi:hypothetical protein